MTTTEVTKLAPTHVIVLAHGLRRVVRWVFHPPGTHDESPIKNDMGALECVTDVGISRWYGCERGWIGPDLRMRVSGFNPRFEEMSAWENG